MNQALELAPALLLAGYALVAIDYGALFFSRASQRVRPSLALLVVWLGHLVYLISAGRSLGQFPASSAAHVLSLVAFTLAGVYLLLEWRTGDRSTGFWTLIQVTGFQVLAVTLAGPVPEGHPYFRHPLFGAHVFLAILGYTAFAVGASYAFLYLSLYHELKGRRFSLFFGRLPPLQVLERMMSGALLVGFVGLTGSLASGVAWTVWSAVDVDWTRDPMILLTAATWVLYGLVLLLFRVRQWHGRQTALAALVGLAVIVGSLLAVGLMMPGIHRPS